MLLAGATVTDWGTGVYVRIEGVLLLMGARGHIEVGPIAGQTYLIVRRANGFGLMAQRKRSRFAGERFRVRFSVGPLCCSRRGDSLNISNSLPTNGLVG